MREVGGELYNINLIALFQDSSQEGKQNQM